MLGPVEARLGLLHARADRGIAPESDRIPAAAAPRYWRYPTIELTQLTINGRAALGDGASLSAVYYRQWFEQRILAYRTATYAALRSSEDDEDDTTGGRATLALPLGALDLRLIGSHQRSTHRQVDAAVPGAVGPLLTYRQTLSSAGAETDVRLAVDTRLTLALGYDRAGSPLTGDKPAQPDQDAVAFSAALRHRLADTLSLTLSGGRRTRFASLRELFGEALGRFLINPGLRAERAWLLDAELAYAAPGLRLTLNPFYASGDDTIAQRLVQVNGAALRQRYNLRGTESFGVDAGVTAILAPPLTFNLQGSYLVARAEPGDAAFRRLLQRPHYDFTALLDYRHPAGFAVRGEVRRTGSAVDLDAFGGKAWLPASTELALRVSHEVIDLGEGHVASLTFAGDNLTDALVLPQSGLPAPGRTIRVGIRLARRGR